jgi:hypothetical protein
MDDVGKLQKDVYALATPAGRKVGAPGHDAAKAYLLTRLTSLNLLPYQGDSAELSYESGRQTFANLVAVAAGLDRQLAPIVIGAHYDSVIDSYCADDNAAAVAIALSAVELLSQSNLTRDVVLALFDAEEPPYYLSSDMGSIRFYREQRRAEGFHAALIMDLVGHDVDMPIPGLQPLKGLLANLLFVMGAESHGSLPNVLKACLPGRELPILATPNRNVGDMSDHHIFRLDGVPYLFLSCGQWPHYHRVTDTPDRLNYQKMAKIRDFVVRLCRTLDGINLSPSQSPPTPQIAENGVVDTTDVEIELIHSALGQSLTAVLPALGLKSLATRQDLDRLAAQFQSFFRL